MTGNTLWSLLSAIAVSLTFSAAPQSAAAEIAFKGNGFAIVFDGHGHKAFIKKHPHHAKKHVKHAPKHSVVKKHHVKKHHGKKHIVKKHHGKSAFHAKRFHHPKFKKRSFAKFR